MVKLGDEIKKMYDYDNYYNEAIYEPSPLDNLMQEYREKCKTILLASVESEINGIKQENNRLNTENKSLRENNLANNSQLALKEKEICKIQLFSDIYTLIQNNINSEEDKNKKDNKIFDFLSFVFKQDYSVKNEYAAPLWIKSLTAFYSHKQEVVEILKLFDCKGIPKNIEDFRLPIDWNEEELDIFFNTLCFHYCTNGNTYCGNLQYYDINSLEDVNKQCHRQYSQIPWQFVLRNPNLKKQKYLEQIGKEMISEHYSNGYNFYKISDYQNLTDEELKIIIENLDYMVWNKGKTTNLDDFILENIRLINNENFLNKVYEYFKDSYNFERQKGILDMPFKFLVKWTENHKEKVSEWLRDNQIEVDEVQKRELMEIIFRINR
ncbi:MAG: hypothetical protein RR710_06610 [Oscillospiraceae bacterium]